MYTPKGRSSVKPSIDKEIVGWPDGYVSTGVDGVIAESALADMTNMDMSQNSLPFIRRSLVPYGKAFVGTCIGIGTFQKTITGGAQERYEISMQVVAGAAQVYTRKDGGAWNIVSGTYTYNTSAWVTFCQSNGRVYITNGKDNLSYYDIVSGAIVTYTQISKPSAPAVTETGVTGTSYTYYYVVTANNESGETDPSAEGHVQVASLREAWDGSTQWIDISWTAVSGADSYNVYVGTTPTAERFLATVVNATSYRDKGASVATITKIPPLTNSTGGPILTYLVNIVGQLWGWGDTENPQFIWYDGGSSGTSGNFTIGGGGGNIAIDDGGPSVPMAILSYRTGKGDPVPTVICNGPGGTGGVRHITFTPETIGDLSALMPSIGEANGDVGTVAPLACVTADNSIHFPTGLGFTFEGSAPNIPNILSPNSSSDFILPDVQKLTGSAMVGARGLFVEGRLYFALPVISETNNQIWVLDLRANPARWIMPWLIPAQHMWLYEDNFGVTHFCLLVNGKELEFSDGVFSNDDGVPFRTRLASGPLRWDKAGISVGYIQKHRLKFVNARGTADINVYGTTLNLPMQASGVLDATQPTAETGWGESMWGEDEFGDDPGVSSTARASSQTIPIPIKDKLSELTWEVVTDAAGCGYALAATHTQGIIIPKLYAGD